MSEHTGPLGLLPEHQKGLTASTSHRLQVLARTDLTVERRSFVSRHPAERPCVDALERELKRFLSLPVLVPDSKLPFAPSIRVDELWHDLILNTPRYRTLCEEVYGRYLDHQPNQEELEDSNAVAIATHTNEMLTRFYGRLDIAIWGSELTRPCYPPPPSNFPRRAGGGQ